MTERTPEQPDDSFFLPDLCSTRAVFLLVVIAELTTFIIVLGASSLSAFDWVLLGKISMLVQWIVLLSAACLCSLRHPLEKLPPKVAAALCWLVIQLVTMVITYTASYVDVAILSAQQWQYTTQVALDVTRNMLISAILGIVILRYFILQQELQLKREAALEAQIQALHSRIRPHFLFNSMNIIASLVHVDPDKAEHVVEDLSDLFRASLQQTATLVELGEELSLCRKYISIEQIRLGQRLKASWDVDDVPMDLPIPSLTLQPMVENAIYHGIQPLAAGGLMQIVVRYDNGLLEIELINPKVEGAPQYSKGNNMATENTRRRLQAIFGEDAKLEMVERDGQFVTCMSYRPEASKVGVRA